MDTTTAPSVGFQQRCRAIVEIIDGQLKIWPIAGSDEQAKEIVDALRFLGEDRAA